MPGPRDAGAATACAGNAFYVICVGDDGTYTARTGPGHSSPNQDIFYGGNDAFTETSFTTIRSYMQPRLRAVPSRAGLGSNRRQRAGRQGFT
jgi:hypothetical protein